MAEWQPIETAPKSGERVLIAHGNSVWEDEWDQEDAGWLQCLEYGFGSHEREVPTHWMPLPDPPEAVEGVAMEDEVLHCPRCCGKLEKVDPECAELYHCEMCHKTWDIS